MIIINSRFLTQETTGVQRFAIEICKELINSNLEIEFVAPKNILKNNLAKQLEVKTIGLLTGHLWEQVTLQAYVFRKKGLLVSFCNTGPVFIKNQLVTIHDLSFRLYPQWNSKIFSLVYNKMIPILAKKSLHVFTVSETSKRELVSQLKIEKEKISVIYNAVSDIFIDKTIKSPKLNKVEDYILTVSSFHPRKNLKKLVEAFVKIPNNKIKLYIVGNVDKNFVFEEFTNKEFSSRIEVFKNVNDINLKSFYQNAKLFVYPSLYEGFGIPIIEAMSCGAPVCVSNIDVFKEVCGKNAIYFDPYNVDEIKNKIISSLENPLNNNIEVKEYSWKRSATNVINVIEQMQRSK